MLSMEKRSASWHLGLPNYLSLKRIISTLIYQIIFKELKHTTSMAAPSQTQSFMESRISTTLFSGLKCMQNNENWYKSMMSWYCKCSKISWWNLTKSKLWIFVYKRTRTAGTTPFFTRLFLQHLRIWSRNLMAGINSCYKKSWIRDLMTL